MKLLIFLALFAFPAFATNFQAQVFTAFDVNSHGAQVAVQHHNDVAVNLHHGHNDVVVVVVNEPQYVNHAQMVKFVGAQHVSTNQVRVVVQRGILRRLALRFGQTRVNCVNANNKVVKTTLVHGQLVGSNARRVKVAVAACR
jgi:hypothetical protein